MRDRSMRRGGRTGVRVFVVFVLFLSKGLLILERGAKIPVKKMQTKQIEHYIRSVIQHILYTVIRTAI